MLVSSHILAEVAQFADHAVVIDRGHLVSAGPMTELVKAARQVIVVHTRPGGAARCADIGGSGGAGRWAGRAGNHRTGHRTGGHAGRGAGIPIFEMTADAAAWRRPSCGAHRGKEAGMTEALHAEFLKWRTTRLVAGMTGFAVALTALIAVLEAVTAGTGKGMAIPSLATDGGLGTTWLAQGSRCSSPPCSAS